jgi:hypothetical protein
MTEQDREQTIELDKLYQQRKSLHKAPHAVQKRVMQEAKARQGRQSWKLNLFNWTTGISLTAATLFLISLVALQWQNLPLLPTSVVQYNWVEMHSLEEEYANVSDASYSSKVKYEQHYAEFLSKQQTFARHHDKIASLKRLDEGWELTTCDEQLVKISAELVQALRELNRIEAELQSGDWVDVAFTKEGRIIGIRQNKNYHQC